MARRLLLLLVLALVAASPAFADLGGQKASIDAKLANVQARISASKQRASALGAQVASLTTQIKALEGRVGDVSSKLSALQSDLALRQRRLDKLNQLYKLQSARLRELKKEYRLAVQRLDTRLVEIYKQGDPTTIDVLLEAKSIQDVISQIDYLGAIARADKKVASTVANAKREVKTARRRTASVRQGVAAEARAVQARVQQQQLLRSQLVTAQNGLAGARSSKSAALQATKQQIADETSEANALAAASADIAAKLRAVGSSTSDGTPSAHGLIYPVDAPITSPFGSRWGTHHDGIDLGAAYGTPIRAAAAGTVLYCGWEEGYGNFTVIDHGGGLATAYGHQSSIAVSCGQHVEQGQVIGYVGSTGHSTGPHLHFEVRVNGSPVDPLGYL
jgi:murein DD-endopeptidase MepM/ murein hydrolase activator NlpD